VVQKLQSQTTIEFAFVRMPLGTTGEHFVDIHLLSCRLKCKLINTHQENAT